MKIRLHQRAAAGLQNSNFWRLEDDLDSCLQAVLKPLRGAPHSAAHRRFRRPTRQNLFSNGRIRRSGC